ncbi:hypothetical protein OA264_02710, partial [Alphaproteobacteria bacterium]|nr:hypothetical protein [Alphaproteobacteria bacterium]
GESLLSPKIVINNNHYLSSTTYLKILKKLNLEVKKKIYSIFWEPLEYCKFQNRSLKSFLFSLNENFGVIKLNNNELQRLTEVEKKILFGKGISFGKTHAFYRKLVETKYKRIRWMIGSIYFKSKILKMPVEERVLLEIHNKPEEILRLIGYIRIKNIAIEISFLENLTKNIFRDVKKVFYFDYYFLSKFQISQSVLFDILVFLGFTKIAGTANVSYWIRKKLSYARKIYNKNSPFYILKKLQ